MSVFEKHFRVFADLLYEALGEPNRWGDAHTAIFKLVEDDIKGALITPYAGHVLHRREGLSIDDLRDEEEHLQNIASQQKPLSDDEKRKLEKKHSEAKPHDTRDREMELADIYPLTGYVYQHISIEPRGKRSAFYEALEQYLGNRKTAGRPHDARALDKIVNLINEIRITAQHSYEHILKSSDEGTISKQDIDRAHDRGNQYMEMALNKINIDADGKCATVMDLLITHFGEEAVKNRIDEHLRPHITPDFAFYTALKPVRNQWSK